MIKTHLESPPEGLPGSASPDLNRGGGVDSPPAKRAWRKPSIREMRIGGATSSGVTDGFVFENSEYRSNSPCDPGVYNCVHAYTIS